MVCEIWEADRVRELEREEQERGAEAKVRGIKGNFTNESLRLENSGAAEHLPGIGSVPSTV